MTCFDSCREMANPRTNAVPPSSSPRVFRCVVSVTSWYIRSIQNASPHPSIVFKSLNSGWRESKNSPCEQVCVVFPGWLHCLPIRSACYRYRCCLQWQVRHTPLPAHHWQHHLTRPSGGALHTRPPPAEAPSLFLTLTPPRSNSLPSSRGGGRHAKKAGLIY